MFCLYNMQKILILGHYGVPNWGDEAILSGMLNDIRNGKISFFQKNTHCTVVSHDPVFTQTEHSCTSVLPPPFGIRSFFSFRWIPFFSALWNADSVIIGGGGLFQPKPRMALWIWAYYTFWILLFRKPLYILGNSFESFSSRGLVYFIIRFFFRFVRHFSVRDEYSKETLISFWWVKKNKISVQKDFAYSVDISLLQNSQSHGIVMMMREGDLSIVQEKKILAYIQKKYPQESIEILVMQYHQSHDEAFAVRHSLPFTFPQTLSEVLQKIISAKLVVSSRLHGNILADHLGVPFLAIAPRKKILSQFGRERCILPEEIGNI